MNYQRVDIKKWDRGELFQHYMKNLRCVMNMTVEMDVTPIVSFTHQRNYKFYPVFMWIVTKVLNAHSQFKYSLNEKDELILWDFISPYYTEFYPDEEKCAKLFTEYCDDLDLFHTRFLEDRIKYKHFRGFDLKSLPRNLFDVSCLPWTKYKSFDIHVFDSGTYLAPVVTWGKYEKIEERYLMPLTMNIHHAVADGYHLSLFFKEVQEMIENFSM